MIAVFQQISEKVCEINILYLFFHNIDYKNVIRTAFLKGFHKIK